MRLLRCLAAALLAGTVAGVSPAAAAARPVDHRYPRSAAEAQETARAVIGEMTIPAGGTLEPSAAALPSGLFFTPAIKRSASVTRTWSYAQAAPAVAAGFVVPATTQLTPSGFGFGTSAGSQPGYSYSWLGPFDELGHPTRFASASLRGHGTGSVLQVTVTIAWDAQQYHPAAGTPAPPGHHYEVPTSLGQARLTAFDYVAHWHFREPATLTDLTYPQPGVRAAASGSVTESRTWIVAAPLLTIFREARHRSVGGLRAEASTATRTTTTAAVGFFPTQRPPFAGASLMLKALPDGRTQAVLSVEVGWTPPRTPRDTIPVSKVSAGTASYTPPGPSPDPSAARTVTLTPARAKALAQDLDRLPGGGVYSSDRSPALGPIDDGTTRVTLTVAGSTWLAETQGEGFRLQHDGATVATLQRTDRIARDLKDLLGH